MSGTQRGRNGMQVITESDAGRTIEISVGQTMEIRLPENPTTGFRWLMTARDESVCAVLHEEFHPPAHAAPGAGGERTWQLEAAAVGECDFGVTYRRPWAADGTSQRTFRLHIRVTP